LTRPSPTEKQAGREALQLLAFELLLPSPHRAQPQEPPVRVRRRPVDSGRAARVGPSLAEPWGSVPVLEVDHDGRTHFIAQSVAIAEYLEERWPVQPLFPKSAIDKAQMRTLVETINSGIQPFHNLSTLDYVKATLGAAPRPGPSTSSSLASRPSSAWRRGALAASWWATSSPGPTAASCPSSTPRAASRPLAAPTIPCSPAWKRTVCRWLRSRTPGRGPTRRDPG